MEWKELFPSAQQPTMEQIEEYIGGKGKTLWQSLVDYMDNAYKMKPKMFYSVCAGKPGWNVKFQKNGQSFGTFYPEVDSFSVLLVISYKLDYLMDGVLLSLSPDIGNLYRQAGDYMKIGKWMMFRIQDETGLEDYKQLISVKSTSKSK